VNRRKRSGEEERLVQAHAQITITIVAIVIGAGALHAAWNAITKFLDDGLAAFALIGVASTVGGGALLAVTGLPHGAAVGYAVTSAVIHVGYELALMNSYRLGAFNQVYPIARGTSPLLVAFGAFFLAGEHLGAVPLAGVAILAAGLASLALSSGRLTRAELPAIGAAVATGVTIAAYTVVDGLGVRRRGVSWLTGPAATGGLLAGTLSLIAYGIVLWAQTQAPLAEVAAIRETSVVFAALIGMRLFSEHFGGRRVAAAMLVAAGIVLISI
jgi:drug/metabolite transporter (DMT)-like permease